MHRVLEGEGTLELSHLDHGKRILLPLHEQVDQSGRRTQGGGVAIELYLRLPVEVVQDATIEGDTSHAYVKGVGLGILLRACLILQHTIAGELHVADP